MARLEAGVYALLSGTSAITDDVPADSIEPWSNHPTVSYPRITFHRDTTLTHECNLSGTSGLVIADVEINIFHTAYPTLQTIAENVRTTMHGYSGMSGSVLMHVPLLLGEDDEHLPPFDGSNKAVYRIEQM